MIIQFHTPKGIVEIDSDKATNSELAQLGMTKVDLQKLIPRDLIAEIDTLKAQIKVLESK